MLTVPGFCRVFLLFRIVPLAACTRHIAIAYLKRTLINNQKCNLDLHEFPPLPLQAHSWHFTPRESKHYSLKAVLHAGFDTPLPVPAVHPSPGKAKAVLSISGQGTFGEIKVGLLTWTADWLYKWSVSE